MRKIKYIITVVLFVVVSNLNSDVIDMYPPNEPTKKPFQSTHQIVINNKLVIQDVVLCGVTDCRFFLFSKVAFRLGFYNEIDIELNCPISIYAIKTDYFNMVNLDDINWDKDTNVKKLNLTINAKPIDRSKYKKIIAEFDLVNFYFSTSYLFQSKLIYTLNDGTQKTKLLEDNVNPYEPITITLE